MSPRRLAHYMRADQAITPAGLWSIAQQANADVFGGSGEWRKGDALEVVAETAADVVYLDPPYPGTTAYGPTYRVLDALLGDNPGSTRVPSLDALLRVSEHVPLLVLSYGGRGVTLDELAAHVGRHRHVVKALEVPYAHLQSIASEEKNVRNRAFLVVATR